MALDAARSYEAARLVVSRSGLGRAELASKRSPLPLLAALLAPAAMNWRPGNTGSLAWRAACLTTWRSGAGAPTPPSGTRQEELTGKLDRLENQIGAGIHGQPSCGPPRPTRWAEGGAPRAAGPALPVRVGARDEIPGGRRRGPGSAANPGPASRRRGPDRLARSRPRARRCRSQGRPLGLRGPPRRGTPVDQDRRDGIGSIVEPGRSAAARNGQAAPR